MPDRAELMAALTDAQATLDEVSEKVELHGATLRRGTVAVAFALVGFALDLTLTVLVGWGLFGVNHNQDRISELTTAQQMEAAKTRFNQCALINLFLDLEKSATTNPNLSEQDRADRVKSYAEIHRIHDALECG